MRHRAAAIAEARAATAGCRARSLGAPWFVLTATSAAGEVCCPLAVVDDTLDISPVDVGICLLIEDDCRL